MAKVIAQKADETQTNTGKTKYKCIGTIDGQLETFDMWDSPELGVEFEGFVKDDPKWGKSVSTKQGGGGGRSFGKSPEEQATIARQNALTNAVNRAIAISGFMGTDEERKEALRPTNICMAAYHFSRFTLGEWNPMADKIENPVQPAIPATTPVEEDTSRQANQAMNEDISPSEIPF